MGAERVAARLPEIETVRNWSRSLAVLDAIMSQEWDYRYFSYDRAWGDGEQMGSMRNGSGDEYSIVFSEHGAFIRGFAHESALSPWAQNPPGVAAGLIDDVPVVFRDQIDEPAFSLNGIPAITVCMWRQAVDSRWHAGRVTEPALATEVDGADWLFDLLDGRPETYVAHAEDYYERTVSLSVVSHVFSQRPLTAQVAATLNPEADIEWVLREARELGYPVDVDEA